MPRKYWKKGQSGNPAGKPKGAKNRFTNLKQAFVNAFERIGDEDALVEFYKTKRNRKAFLQMVANMLPKDVTLSGNPDAPIQVQFNTIKGMIEHANSSGEPKTGIPEGDIKVEGESKPLP